MQSITVHELNARLSDGDIDEILVDVREPNEYKSVHIAEAKNIPLTKVHDSVDRLRTIKSVYVLCASGVRSTHACQILHDTGLNVINVEGGLGAWERAGLPMVRTGKQVIPIVRQVMLVAGSLVLIGIIFGVSVNSWWLLCSALVGAGLTFAGATGICGMQYVLERMPWNH